MASSDTSFELCRIVTENAVNSLLNTLLYGERKFLIWTRLCLENSSWIINTSDGVDVWKLEIDGQNLDSYRRLSQMDTFEMFFTKIRSDFLCGNLLINLEPDKIILTVGVPDSSLNFDLYETSADDKKTELQVLILRMADDIINLTEKLKVSTESLERMKNQKDSNVNASSIFDIPQKKVKAPTVKRKQGYSLVNPGSQKFFSETVPVLATEADNLEGTVHISVLSGNQMLDIYRCTDPSQCPFPCGKGSRRYHCPLCHNRPQKPGRMRRHFFLMHAGNHVVEHEGFRILRCKLKCSRANGRITDCSHYHCCLCGRVCLRKVHLCCHLQAHTLGTAKDVEDDMIDIKGEEDPEEEEEAEDEADDADDHDADTTDETVLQTSQMACSIAGETENMVTLSDGTQVVYVQSVDNETLTVVPVSTQSESIQMSSTPDQLNSSLQVLATPQATNEIQGLGRMTQDVTQQVGGDQDLETILNQEQTREVAPSEASVRSESSIAPTGISSFHTYTSQQTEQVPSGQALHFTQSYNELTNGQDDPTQEEGNVVFERESPTATATHIQKPQGPMSVELSGVNSDLDINALVATSPVPATQIPNIEGGTSSASPALTSTPIVTSDSPINQFQNPTKSSPIISLVATSPVPATQIPNIEGGTSSASPALTSSPIITSDSPINQFQNPAKSSPIISSEPSSQLQSSSFTVSDQSLRNYRVSDSDSPLVLKCDGGSQEDDRVFSKLFGNITPCAENVFQHPSVVPEQFGMTVSRCKNTECDCRLYHCPLCTCLPNKPGRIREHFRKVHADTLIIKYRGYQMLRCKLGCCRPTGRRILNSHYHCFLCGCICISKPGVYEHVRTQHSHGTAKAETRINDRPEKRKSSANSPPVPTKKQAVVPTQLFPPKIKQDEAASQNQRPLVVQVPNSLSGLQPTNTNQRVSLDGQGLDQPSVVGTSPQQMTVQLPDVQASPSHQQQQPLVIFMPQQSQNFIQGQQQLQQQQQPIVIVMPQGGGTGGVQMAQPIIVPMPQSVNN